MNEQENGEQERETAEQQHDEAKSTALSTLLRAEIDTQISTAKSYPRSLKTFKARATSMATLDEETAGSMFYSLPRGGKRIEGPSARFAEIAAAAWGNMRFGSRVVNVDERMLTSQGVCHDLESNNVITIEVQRRITDKNGKRYNDDMIVMTGNAAGSIALRNAVLKVIPKAYWNPVFMEARKIAIGDARTLVTRRQQAFEYFAKLGVDAARVLAVLEKHSIDDVDLEDLETLTGLRTAIKDGDTSLEEAFPTEDAARRAAEKLANAAPAKNGGAAKAPAPAQPAADRSIISALETSPMQQETEMAILDEMKRTGQSQDWLHAKVKEVGAPVFSRLTEAGANTILAEMRSLPDAVATVPMAGPRQPRQRV